MPRKLGQHFLRSDSVLEQLAAAACGERTSRVIEIGPGRGALTSHLLLRSQEVHAIEVDPELVRYLKVKFANDQKLHIHEADILAEDVSKWGPAVITGNLPYYITSPIIEKFLNLDARFQVAVFLMQREVAERVLAQPGSRDYGYLSVCVQLLCEAELVCRVAAAAFSPAPKVESSALRLRRRSSVPENLTSLRKMVSRSFAQKRKTLRNNLRAYYGEAVDALPEAGLRAEQLKISDFVDVHRRLEPAAGD